MPWIPIDRGLLRLDTHKVLSEYNELLLISGEGEEYARVQYGVDKSGKPLKKARKHILKGSKPTRLLSGFKDKKRAAGFKTFGTFGFALFEKTRKLKTRRLSRKHENRYARAYRARKKEMEKMSGFDGSARWFERATEDKDQLTRMFLRSLRG